MPRRPAREQPHPAAPRRRALAAAVLAGLPALCGCANRHAQLVPYLRSHETPTATGDYVVMPPDAITVHAPGAPEIDGVTQTVRADGKVVLRLLGEVQVAGLTTAEAAEKIRAQLSRYYMEPEVAVEVTDYRSKFYYVLGQVESPGSKAFTGRNTLLKAIADARPTFLAWTSQIRLTRPSPEGEAKTTIVFDLDHLLRSGDASANFLLQEGDVIEVPPTPLAWLGLRVRELLYPIEPAVRTYSEPAVGVNAYRTYDEEWGGSGRDEDSRRLFSPR